MLCLRILSRLLDYPTAELSAHGAELRILIATDPALSDTVRQSLQRFLEQRLSQDLCDWQSEYDGLFDRGRAVSLHLFEHVHGESRDRGQAMVDLLANYRQAGLELGVRELPDYLPLYLEFAATQEGEGTGWLLDIAPVLALLTARLQERDSDYALLTGVLLELSGASVELSPLRDEVAREARDDTPEALDRLWEDEAVSFAATNASGARSSCPTERNRPTAAQRRDDELPLRIIDPSPAPVGHP